MVGWRGCNKYNNVSDGICQARDKNVYPINISIHAKLFQVSKAALSSRDVGLISSIIIFFLLFLCLPDRSFVHSHPLQVASGRGSVLWMIQLGRSGAPAPSPAKHLLFFLFLHID